MRKKRGKARCEQDSNLRGNIPLDFKSNALTTRPSQHPAASRLATANAEIGVISPTADQHEDTHTHTQIHTA